MSKKVRSSAVSAGSTSSAKESGVGDRIRSLLFRGVKDDGSQGMGGTFTNFGTLSQPIWQSIGSQNDLAVRLKTLSTLDTYLDKRRLETNTLEALWQAVKDILEEENHMARDQILSFVSNLTKCQYAQLGLPLRAIFFQTISKFGPQGQLGPAVFNWLRNLTREGKDTEGFEEELSPLVTEWAQNVLTESSHASVFPPEFLEFLLNVVKNNAAYLEDDDVISLLDVTCKFGCNPDTKDADVSLCLEFVDNVLCYGIVPLDSLPLLVVMLCNLVNNHQLCNQCWRLIKSLFNSHLGYTTVQCLCDLLTDDRGLYPATVLRGAVSFVGLGLWGPHRVQALRHNPSSLLPAFYSVLQSNSVIVTFEVLLMVQRLVQKYGRDLQLITWNSIFRILNKILELQETGQLPRPESALDPRLHEILNVIEHYYDNNTFGGSAESLFRTVERCSSSRPDCSIFLLLSYQAQSIHPTKEDWLSKLFLLTRRYYKEERRPGIRIKSIQIVRALYTQHKNQHGHQLVKSVILPIMYDLDMEKDSEICVVSINFLSDISTTLSVIDDEHPCIQEKQAPPDHFVEIIKILDKVINRQLDEMQIKLNKDACVEREDQLKSYVEVVEAAFIGLQSILESKWDNWPPNYPLLILDVLSGVLTTFYMKGLCGECGGDIRERLLIWLTRLRADPNNARLGLELCDSDEKVTHVYTAYTVCADPNEANTEEERTEDGSVYRWTGVVNAITMSIQKECWWPVLRHTLDAITVMLHNRPLVLSDPESIEPLCSALVCCSYDANRPPSLIDVAENFTTSELRDCICPALATLVTYKNFINDNLQRKMVMSIQESLVSERSYNAVVATIHCLLELPNIMQPMTRDLVRRLADLPSGPKIGIPIIELLTTLVRLPHLYEHFEEKHYHYVVDILIPYTDTQRFTTFIVAMAYRMIYRWFLRTVISMRPSLAKYIINETNAAAVKTHSREKLESSSDSSKSVLDSLKTIENECRNVLIDFLRHFTFTNEPSLLFSSDLFTSLSPQDVRCRYWIVNDTIVTVKTVHLYKKIDGNIGLEEPSFDSIGGVPKFDVEPNPDDRQSPRRRHQSAIQRRVTKSVPPGVLKSMDDSCISTSPKLSAPKPERVRIRSRPEICDDVVLCSPSISLGSYTQVDIRHAFGHSSRVFRNDHCGLLSQLTAEQLEMLSMITDVENRRSMMRNYSDVDFGVTFETNQTDECGTIDQISRNSSFSSKSTSGQIINEHRSTDQSHCRPISVDVTSRDFTTSPLSSASSAYYSVRSERVKSPREQEEIGLVNPAWAFGQICQASHLPLDSIYTISPSKLSGFDRSLRMLDLKDPCEVNTIGVLYIGSRQTNETEILSNEFGSERYARFIAGLGFLTPLKNEQTNGRFLGGLRTDGTNGMFTYKWNDPITEVVFHVATLMPTLDSDPTCKAKKLLIGNDFVSIIYNDSGQQYRLGMISGQFAHVAIVVQPRDAHTLAINIRAKDEISRWIAMKGVIVSDDIAPLLCRQMAMRADLSVRIWRDQETDPNQPYLSRAIERYRQIRQIKERFGQSSVLSSGPQTKTFLDWV